MSEELFSVGLDVGTTTTQLILSRLKVENRASGFAVPEMDIIERSILYKSPVYFTPLLHGNLVDGEGVRKIVAAEYEKAGIDRSQVDTGAIIITGETSRKENARTVLEAVAAFAGDFVVASAGPDLESILAAKGAGAVAFSENTGKTVLHMDIGGGTSNLALIENGCVVGTGCLNVGGRLLKFDADGGILYVSPVLQGLTSLQVGEHPTTEQIENVAHILVEALEMAAGMREKTELFHRLTTKEAAGALPHPAGNIVLSFSGGVADCIENSQEPLCFGDMGPILGRVIRKSRLCQGEFVLGTETIRATAIGAGCHSTQLSGSTVFYRGVELPVKNLPVALLNAGEQEDPQVIAQRLAAQDAETVVLAMPGYAAPCYERVSALATAIAAGARGRPIFVCLESDMAKALGHRLCLLLPPDTPCLCIDRVRLTDQSYLDVGAPVGPALPVVIKTLVLPQKA